MKKFWNDIEVQILEKNKLKKENEVLKSIISSDSFKDLKNSKGKEKSGILKLFKRTRKTTNIKDSSLNSLSDKMSEFQDYADFDLDKFRQTAEVVFRQSYKRNAPRGYFARSNNGDI